MKFERIPATGHRCLIAASRSRNRSLSPKRRILRNTDGLACWKDRSKYGTTPAVPVMTSTKLGRISAGCR